jgi:hypothetical protein
LKTALNIPWFWTGFQPSKIGAGFHDHPQYEQRTSHYFKMMTHNQCQFRNKGHSDSSIKIWNFLKK